MQEKGSLISPVIPKPETPRSFYVAGTTLGIIGLILVSKTIETVPYFLHPDNCFGKAYEMFGFALGIIFIITSALLLFNKKAGLYLFFLAALSPIIYSFFDYYLYDLCKASTEISTILLYIVLVILSLLLIAFYTIMASQYIESRLTKKEAPKTIDND